MNEFAADKVFLPYQQELLSSTSLYQVLVVEKSRRTGYSWAVAAIAVMTAAPAENSQNVYYMGYDYEMAREFIQYVGEWAKKIGETVSELEEYVFKDPEKPDKDIKAFRVTFANGREVVALPSVARAFRGKQGLVIIDEAAFHDDLAEVLKSAFALLIWGGKVIIISTHNGDDNPFNELIKDIRGGKKPYKLLRCTFDDALEKGLYKRICQKQNEPWSLEKEQSWRKSIMDFYGDDADEELFCIPSKGTGAYLTRALIEKCMRVDIPVISVAQKDEFALLSTHLREAEINDWLDENIKPILQKLNPLLVHGIGFDFARNSDLSVLWILSEQADLSLHTEFVVEIRNMPHEQQKQILFYVIDKLPRFRFAALDAGGNGSYVAEVTWQRYGESMVEKVMFSLSWYRDNMPKLKSVMEDNSLTLPQNNDILADFKALKVIKGVPSIPNLRTKDESGNKRHGDGVIACALAVYAMKKDNIPAYDGCISSKSLSDENTSFNKEGCW